MLNTQHPLEALRQRASTRLNGDPIEAPFTTEQEQALAERNKARAAEAISKLGHAWVLASGRRRKEVA